MKKPEINHDAPTLAGLEKRNVYRTPDDFFREMESDTMKSISAKTRVRLVRMERWFELSLAAAIIAVALFSGTRLMPDKLNLNDSGAGSGFYNVPGEESESCYPLF